MTLDTLNDRANSSQSAFITGIPTRDLNSGSRYNSLIALGDGEGSYQKQKLVPFGEYIPFVNVLGGNGPFSTYKSPKFYLSFTILVSFILVRYPDRIP